MSGRLNFRSKKWVPTLIATLLILPLLLPGLDRLIWADGDPLEEYDFTGQVPPSDFAQQFESVIYQHGLWTVQQMTEWNPFEGGDAGRMWSFRENDRTRIGIYYGTRPMWASDWEKGLTLQPLRVSGSTDGNHGPLWAQRGVSSAGDARCLPLSDGLGGNDLTLVLKKENWARPSAWSAEIIRLSGDDPASAKVESLWSGRAPRFLQLDDDPAVEIVTEEFYFLGDYFWGTYPFRIRWILDWSDEAGAFVPANDRLFHAWRRVAFEKSLEDSAAEPGATFAEAEAWLASIVEGADSAWGVDSGWDAQARLLYSMLALFGNGHGVEAKAILDAYPYEIRHQFEGTMPKDQFWDQMREDLIENKDWPRLLAMFPQLSFLAAPDEK